MKSKRLRILELLSLFEYFSGQWKCWSFFTLQVHTVLVLLVVLFAATESFFAKSNARLRNLQYVFLSENEGGRDDSKQVLAHDHRAF